MYIQTGFKLSYYNEYKSYLRCSDHVAVRQNRFYILTTDMCSCIMVVRWMAACLSSTAAQAYLRDVVYYVGAG